MEKNTYGLKSKLSGLDAASAFVFDMDGTLVDLEAVNFEGYRQVLEERFGMALSKDEYREVFAGTPTKEAFVQFCKSRGITECDAVDLAYAFWDAKWGELEERARDLVIPKAGAREFLQLLKGSGAKMALVTSASPRSVELSLEPFGFMEYFPVVLTADDVLRGKPDPAIYVLALERLGVSAKEAVAFEDSRSGIEAAMAAGIYCVGVSNGEWNADFVEMADSVIENFRVCIDFMK